MSKRQFYRIVGLTVAILLGVAVVPAFAAKKRAKEKEKPAKPKPAQTAPAKPPAKDATQYASDPLRIVFVGEVVSVDPDKRTIVVKGESRQQGKAIGGAGTHTFVLSSYCLISTSKKDIATLADISVGDAVELTYSVTNGKNVAASIVPSTAKKSEKKPDAGKK